MDEKNKIMLNLIEIKSAVDSTLNLDVSKITRKRGNVEGKIIYFILSTIFTKERVGKIIFHTGRKHCVAAYYRKSGIALLQYDKDFKQKYINCLKAINANDEEIQQLIQSEYLKTIIYR